MNISRFRALLIICLTSLSLFVLIQAAVAESDALISFESEEPITFSYDISKSDDPESSQNDDFVVRIFNNTAESFTLDVQIRDFGTEDKLSEALTVDMGKTAASLNASELAELYFLVEEAYIQDLEENKTYSGELYITAEATEDANQVEVIHQKLSLEITTLPSSPSSLTLQNSPSYLTEIVFEGTNSQPTAPLLLIILSLATLIAAYRLWERTHLTVVLTVLFIAIMGIAGAYFLGGSVKIEPIILDGATASESVTQVGFVSANSQIVPITQNGSQYSVEGISGAGQYTGNIDMLPDDKDKTGDIAVKVNVKDAWPFAVITIALGTLVGFLIKDYYKVSRQKSLNQILFLKEEGKLSASINWLSREDKKLGGKFVALLSAAKSDMEDEKYVAESIAEFESFVNFVSKIEKYADTLAKFTRFLEDIKQYDNDDEKYKSCLVALNDMAVSLDDYKKEKIEDTDLHNMLQKVEKLRKELFTKGAGLLPLAELDTGVELVPDEEAEKDKIALKKALHDLKRDDSYIAILAALLAVTTGFATLYTKADVTFWGTPGTYLAAFLWGAGVAEGSKLALDIVTAIWKKAD